MKKDNKRILFLLLINSAVIALLAAFMPKQLDWNPSFSKYKNSPYGSEAIYENLKDIYEGENFTTKQEPLYNVVEDTSFIRTNYIIINSDFYADSLDLSALYQIVEKGNNVFLSAENFSDYLTDSLGINNRMKFNDFPSVKELNETSTALSIINPTLGLDTGYNFKSQYSFRYFDKKDSSDVQAYGLGMQDSSINFVKVKYGKGFFFLHTFPYAFTNYYLMKDESRAYISSVFSYLPSDYDVIWDEYYKPGRGQVQSSPLSVLLRYKGFRWVYWLAISGIALFMIFYAKRKQRAIPIISPPKNDSLNFIQTLGSLYFNLGSHKDLVDKKILVFKDYLSNKYFMKDLAFTTEEAKHLALKSGKETKLIVKIFELINRYKELNNLSDGQLKSIIKSINKFYDRN